MTTSPPSPNDRHTAFLEKHADVFGALPQHTLRDMALLKREEYDRTQWANCRPKCGDCSFIIIWFDKDGNIHKKADRGHYVVENDGVMFFSTIEWEKSKLIRYVGSVRSETPISWRKKTAYGRKCTVAMVDVKSWTTIVVYDGLRR